MIISRNQYLTVGEMTPNAKYIYDKLRVAGWTPNAICGLLGNTQTESTNNFGLWESLDEGNMSAGFGLVQWTPASKYTNWADSQGYSWGNPDGQIARILYEVENGLQWIATSEYPMSFYEFTQSTQTPYYLAMVFIKNYERPFNSNQPIRGEQAEYWFETLSDTPVTPVSKKKKLPIWVYCNIRF